MGFKKSEYRKKFKRVPTEKLIAISSENARYRADRRLREYRHEPLDWDSEGYDSESENGTLPPTRLRLRHLRLTAGRDKRWDTTSSRDASPGDDEARPRFVKDVGVQTEAGPSCRSEWTQTERTPPRGRPSAPSPGEMRKVDRWDKSPFEAYGAADEVDTMSGKRTFNVAASTGEIHPTALMAAQRRRVPPSPHRRRSRCRSANAALLLRHGWVSEYGEKYK